MTLDPEAIAGFLGGIDMLLALILAVRWSGGSAWRFVKFLRDPPAPAALRGYGDLVEILCYCWLLVVAASLLAPGEEFLAGLSLGTTLAFTATSIVYLACLLGLRPSGRP
ncbi:MAG: hypothetical protein FJZ01_15135 [Candidatus Sericytochromatia bacterium]|nr:hypothetical protein [Candidatus Tanganyikabacteria bacterium]